MAAALVVNRPGIVNLVVARVLDGGRKDGNDLVTMWVNPTDLSSEDKIAATAAVTVTLDREDFWDSGQGISAVQAWLAGDSGSRALSNATLDEFRLATTLAWPRKRAETKKDSRGRALSFGQAPKWYGGEEAMRIADSIVPYQRASGGWPKAEFRILNDEHKAMLRENPNRAVLANKTPEVRRKCFARNAIRCRPFPLGGGLPCL